MRAARGLLVAGSGEGVSAGAAHVRDLRRRGSPKGRSLAGWGREEMSGGRRSRHLVVDIIIQAWKEGDESVPTSCRRSDCVAASSLPFPSLPLPQKEGDDGGETGKMGETRSGTFCLCFIFSLYLSFSLNSLLVLAS
jgi:hypothetical protein